MHQFASGTGAGIGLSGEEPPLSPETIGRSASSYLDPAIKIVPLTQLAAVPTAREAAPAEVPAGSNESCKLVVRLLGGEELTLGSFEDRADAKASAQELVARLSAAEAAGDWPEIAERFVRPSSIASVDIV